MYNFFILVYFCLGEISKLLGTSTDFFFLPIYFSRKYQAMGSCRGLLYSGRETKKKKKCTYATNCMVLNDPSKPTVKGLLVVTVLWSLWSSTAYNTRELFFSPFASGCKVGTVQGSCLYIWTLISRTASLLYIAVYAYC